jgi:hypothetical protein
MVKSNSLRATKSIAAWPPALVRLDRDLGADEADLMPGLRHPSALGKLASDAKDGVEVWMTTGRSPSAIATLLSSTVSSSAGASISASRAPGRRLRQPGREPEGLDLALGLVARAGAAVEAVEGRGLEITGWPLRNIQQDPGAPSKARAAVDAPGARTSGPAKASAR